MANTTVNKEYYGADALYRSEKTNDIYVAYNFADSRYLVARERESGTSVITFFYCEDETEIMESLKAYADLFESMEPDIFMATFNGIN